MYQHDLEIRTGDRAFLEFKGRIKKSGDGLILITVGGQDVSVVEVVSHLLKIILDDAQTFVQIYIHKKGIC